VDLLENPFYILTATPRDNRSRIMELADERSLMLDSNECMNARSDLTNPRKRLSSEVAWLIGLSPKRSSELLSLLQESPADILSVDKLSPVVRANLLSASFSRLSNCTSDCVAKWILEISWAFEKIDLEELMVIINDERVVSGFPEVTDISILEREIQERRLYYRQTFKSALNNLSAKDLVRAVTIAVESATANGKNHCPVLIVDLVSDYEVEAQDFLEKEERNIKFLVEKLRSAADANYSDSTLTPIVNQLINVVKNWDIVAQPIQVSAKSLGVNHEVSRRVAELVRDLAIHMFNQHGKLDFSRQLTHMLQEVFAEVEEVAERTAEDANTLGNIAEKNRLNHLLDPIFDLCKVVIENSEKYPTDINKHAQQIMNAAPQLIKNLSTSEVSAKVLSQGKDELALTLMHCAVIYGNKTEKWSSCIPFLERALQYASSQEVKSRIQKNLEIVKGNEKVYDGLKPLSSAPSLSTFNGIGMTLYGATDHDEVSGSYLSTYYFVFLAIPLFPICRYRVIKTVGGYQFLGKSPLRKFDKWHIAIFLGILFWMFTHG
jgi:hypothetical protein